MRKALRRRANHCWRLTRGSDFHWQEKVKVVPTNRHCSMCLEMYAALNSGHYGAQKQGVHSRCLRLIRLPYLLRILERASKVCGRAIVSN